MKKQLLCRNLGKDCDFTVSEESEKEILRRSADHYKTAHSLEFTKEIRERAQSMIREPA